MGPHARADAYATCLRLARVHYENFPVASRLLPRRLHPHVAAVYAFARAADDFADEPGLTNDQRLQALEHWRALLHGQGRLPAGVRTWPLPASCAHAASAADIFSALHDTIARFELPLSLFDDLLSAFTDDVTITRYERWTHVLDYCRRSANPIGRLVLRLMGQASEARDGLSDKVCTALQLTNFWQDLAIDWRRGRLYLPAEVWRRLGAHPGNLDGGRMTTAWRTALAECTSRTRQLFLDGRGLCDEVTGRLRYELRVTWLGGTRILERLEQVEFDVFARRPELTAADWAMIGARALCWRRR
jgi:squalene synthase HpnC